MVKEYEKKNIKNTHRPRQYNSDFVAIWFS